MKNLKYFILFLICFNAFGKLSKEVYYSYFSDFEMHVEEAYEAQEVSRLFDGIHSDTRDIRQIYSIAYNTLKHALENVAPNPVDLNLLMQEKLELTESQKQTLYHVVFLSLKNYRFENLVLISLILERNNLFKLELQEKSRDYTEYTYGSLIAVLTKEWAQVKGLKDPFRLLLCLHFILKKAKTHQSNAYLKEDAYGRTALMHAVHTLELLRGDYSFAYDEKEVLRRFEKLFYLFLSYGFKPSYFEIKYTLRKLPFLKKTIFLALKEHNYLSARLASSELGLMNQIRKIDLRKIKENAFRKFGFFSRSAKGK